MKNFWKNKLNFALCLLLALFLIMGGLLMISVVQGQSKTEQTITQEEFDRYEQDAVRLPVGETPYEYLDTLYTQWKDTSGSEESLSAQLRELFEKEPQFQDFKKKKNSILLEYVLPDTDGVYSKRMNVEYYADGRIVFTVRSDNEIITVDNSLNKTVQKIK